MGDGPQPQHRGPRYAPVLRVVGWAHSFVNNNLHCVFSTRERQNLILPDFKSVSRAGRLRCHCLGRERLETSEKFLVRALELGAVIADILGPQDLRQ